MSKKLELVNKKIKDRLEEIENILIQSRQELKKYEDIKKTVSDFLTSSNAERFGMSLAGIMKYNTKIDLLQLEKDFLNNLLIEQI